MIKKEYFYSNISNLRKIESVTYKPQILETFENLRNFSFEDKKEAVMDETKMNKFLDRIIGFKKSLMIKTEEKINNDEQLKYNWGTICTLVEMKAADGKIRKIQSAHTEHILRLIQSIPL